MYEDYEEKFCVCDGKYLGKLAMNWPLYNFFEKIWFYMKYIDKNEKWLTIMATYSTSIHNNSEE